MTALVFVFAFSSVLGNYVYAEINLFFLGAKKNAIMIFRLLVLGAIALGATSKLATVWDIADIAMGFMALVNLVAIVLLGKWAFAAIRDYHRQSADGSDPVFVAEQRPACPGCWRATSGAGGSPAAGVTSCVDSVCGLTSHPGLPLRQPRGLSLRTALPGCQRGRHRAGADALPR